MSWSKALLNYALMTPSKIGDVLLTHTENTVTVIDGYEKGMYHYLVLPRLPSPLGVSQGRLSSLRALLAGDKAESLRVLNALASDANEVKSIVEKKMKEKYGTTWPIWIGFHAVPSMEHLHVHVISSDLVTPKLKNKKHYNSFHPTLGFFLHIQDVMTWLTEEKLASRLDIKEAKYEAYLKADLACYKCEEPFKQMPKLKDHLEEEWRRTIKSSQILKAVGQKRPRREDDSEDEERPKKKVEEDTDHAAEPSSASKVQN